MARAFAEIGFTPAVREVQRRHGSAADQDRLLAADAEPADRLGPAETAFIAGIDGMFQATVGAGGWPYVQFRGGPKGFLAVLDERTLAYPDFRGNRQYLSAGNLSGDDRIALIMVDYPSRRRLKLWGRARLVAVGEDRALEDRLRLPGYRALPERAVVIEVAALDWNCPQHIPRRMTIEELEPELALVRAEVARLRAENEDLKRILAATG